MLFRRTLLPLLALALAAVDVAAQPRSIRSDVVEVTVYNDRALIVRKAPVRFEAGTQTVILAGLPEILLNQSLRLWGEADSALTIGDIKIETAFFDTIPETRIRSLIDRKEKLVGEQRSLTDRLLVVSAQRQYLDSLRSASARQTIFPPGRSPFDEWDKMLAFIDKKYTGLYEEIRAVNAKIEDVKQKIQALDREIRESQALSRKSEKRVQATLTARRAGNGTLYCSYVLFGPHWVPQYELRAQAGEPNVSLSYAAMVRQSTGEDWKNVRLSLSTARPAEGGAIPALETWFVDRYQPPPAPSAGGVRDQMPMLKMESRAISKEADALVAAEFERAEVSSQLASSSFTMPSSVDVPSDNMPHRMQVASLILPAELKYVSVPKLVPAVFVSASVNNKSEYPLVAGGMNIFLNGVFVAATRVTAVMPGEKTDVSLGTDDGITVKRTLLNKFTDTPGLLSSKVTVTYDFLLTIENKRTSAVQVEVKDQIPVSQNDEITVQQIEPALKEMSPDRAGVLTWKVVLAPGAKKEIKFKFSVSHPQGWTIRGLE